jgi:hypothetical protein
VENARRDKTLNKYGIQAFLDENGLQPHESALEAMPSSPKVAAAGVTGNSVSLTGNATLDQMVLAAGGLGAFLIMRGRLKNLSKLTGSEWKTLFGEMKTDLKVAEHEKPKAVSAALNRLRTADEMTDADKTLLLDRIYEQQNMLNETAIERYFADKPTELKAEFDRKRSINHEFMKDLHKQAESTRDLSREGKMAKRSAFNLNVSDSQSFVRQLGEARKKSWTAEEKASFDRLKELEEFIKAPAEERKKLTQNQMTRYEREIEDLNREKSPEELAHEARMKTEADASWAKLRIEENHKLPRENTDSLTSTPRPSASWTTPASRRLNDTSVSRRPKVPSRSGYPPWDPTEKGLYVDYPPPPQHGSGLSRHLAHPG